MVGKALLIVLLSLIFRPGIAQTAGAHAKVALRDIERQRWDKAEPRLRKSLSKNPLDPAVRYALSVFYLHPANPAYNLDSAHRYALTALSDFASTSRKTRHRLLRLSLDSAALSNVRAKIDSTAFERSKAQNTEAAYIQFLNDFPSAVQADLAAELRDEVAFQESMKEGSVLSFRRYLDRYPQSRRASEVRDHLDRLLFHEATKDKGLASYEKFLEEHPETPYESEIWQNIFEIATAEATLDSFLSFIQRYPNSKLVSRARRMMFHLLADEEDPVWPANLLNDSLKHLLDLNSRVLIPFYTNDRYGFMDDKGAEVIDARYERIDERYLCGDIRDDVLIANDQLVARNGAPVHKGAVLDVMDLGAGLLKINTGKGTSIIHKGGFLIRDSIEDALVLSKQFLAIKDEGFWHLHTLSGRALDNRAWNEISSVQGIVIFTKGDDKFIIRLDQIARSPESDMLFLSEAFDDVKPWPNGLIWGRSGSYEGVLDGSLQGVIRFDQHTLTQTFFGAAAAVRNGFALYNWAGKKSPTFERIKIMGERVAVRKNGLWYLMEPGSQAMQSSAYDSLRSEGPFFVGIRGDSVTVHFKETSPRPFIKPQKIAFIPGMDSTSYLLVQQKGRKTVYDLKGREMFSAVFDEIEYAGSGAFVITKSNRKGLINKDGKLLLPAGFDAIGSAKDGFISVLKNKKFGGYNMARGTFINPEYDRNVTLYTKEIAVYFHEGKYGFYGPDNKPLSEFLFDEIAYWNDSTALVKQGSTWNFYDINSTRFTASDLRSFTFIGESPGERIAIVQKGNEYGVVDNSGKAVVPITFTEVLNLGSSESPLFFAEKHIPEASLFVVIYYDASGTMLRKEIYDDAEDYDQIYCSDQ